VGGAFFGRRLGASYDTGGRNFVDVSINRVNVG
jgi:hypothetical protein